MLPLKNPRLAIIGCGAIVDFHMVKSLLRCDWLPAVLVDTSEERLAVIAGKVGSRHGRVIQTKDWRSAADDFDAAVLALPHALHAPFAVELAAAGKHLFIEKPLATNTRDCRAIIAAANNHDVVLSVGLLRRFLTISQWTKALLDSGTLGTITRFTAREGFIFNYPIASDFFFQPGMAGGGVLMDTGAHTLDLLQWWLGGVAALTYRDNALGGVETDCTLECVMVSGAHGTVELSRSRNLRNSIRIEGTNGWVEVHLYRNSVLGGSRNALDFVHQGVASGKMEPQEFPDLFEAEFRNFRASIEGEDRPRVAGVDGLPSVALIERCYASQMPLALPWALPRSAATAPLLPADARVTVIGASGFIGGRMVERLATEQNIKVRAVVRDLAHAASLARFPIEIVRTDLADPVAVDRAIAGSTFVFNCAYDLQIHSQNLVAMRNIVDACGRHPIRRLVHLSSFSVYLPFEDGPLTEDASTGNRNIGFVANKLEVEEKTFAWSREAGVEATVLQPSIVYGPFCKPWTNTPAEMLIYGDVVLPDNGGICNAVYVDDVTDAMMLAAVSPAARGEKFIISGPGWVTWEHFFAAFAGALGTAPPQTWSRDAIKKQNGGFARGLLAAVSNPRQIIKSIIRSKRGRAVAQACLEMTPAAVRARMLSAYRKSGAYRFDELILPDPNMLRLYAAKATVASEKAQEKLGYRPRFGFDAGMDLTGAYLRWAYGDIQKSSAPLRKGRAGLAA